jgi:hypothetical protein
MSLWNVLSIMAGSAAFSGSLAAAVVMRGGRSSLLISALMGVVLGALAVYLPQAVRTRIQETVSLIGDGPTPLWLRVLYGGACVWICIAAYISNVTTRLLLTELMKSASLHSA